MPRYLSWIFLSCLCLPALVFGGGGWPQPKGQGYFKLSQTAIRAGRFFSGTGEVLDITTISVYQTALYGEYGFTPRLTGLVYAPFFVRTTLNRRESTVNDQVIPGDEFQGPGNMDLGLKYGLLTEGPVVLSASLLFSLPTGRNVGGETELLQTGDGAFSQLVQLEASHSFYPRKVYVTLATGFRHRGQATYEYASGPQEVDYSDEFRWGGEVGWTPGKWSVAMKWLQVLALGNGNSAGETGASSLFGNNISYFSYSPEVSYLFHKNWGLNAAAAFALSGENILAAPTYQLGLVWKVGT